MSRFARTLAATALLAALLAGCGSSSNTTTQSATQTQGSTTAAPGASSSTVPTSPAPSSPSAPAGTSARSCIPHTATTGLVMAGGGVACDTSNAVVAGWLDRSSCFSPAGASRYSCTVRHYRCLGTRTDRGVAVSCARAGRSVAFIAKRG
jgi:hypothetical protein